MTREQRKALFKELKKAWKNRSHLEFDSVIDLSAIKPTLTRDDIYEFNDWLFNEIDKIPLKNA